MVQVSARREQIRGLCWQLKTNFLPVCLPSRQLMPNILRKGKHKKLSSLNRRRGAEKIIVILGNMEKCISQFYQYRFVFMGCLWKYLSHSGCFTFIGKFSCHCISNDFSVNPNRNIFSKKDKRNTLTSLGIFSLLRNKLSTPTDWSQHVLELQIVQQLRVNLQFFQWRLSWQKKTWNFVQHFVLILEHFLFFTCQDVVWIKRKSLCHKVTADLP